MYCTNKEPADFGTQEDVLANNYWPRVGDPEVADLGSARSASSGGLAGLLYEKFDLPCDSHSTSGV